MITLKSMRVAQVRILQADEIPYGLLQFGGAADSIQQAFKFKQLAPIQVPVTPVPTMGMAFASGELVSVLAAISIEQILIEPRRITVAVNGTSEQADQVFARLVEILLTIDQRPIKPNFSPLILTQETITVVRLDFPFTKLFEGCSIKAFTDKMSSLVDKNEAGSIMVWPTALRLRVSYLDVPAKFKANSINVVDKEIRIEQRRNTAIDQNTYFISSPNSSDIHMKLIAQLEEVFGTREA